MPPRVVEPKINQCRLQNAETAVDSPLLGRHTYNDDGGCSRRVNDGEPLARFECGADDLATEPLTMPTSGFDPFCRANVGGGPVDSEIGLAPLVEVRMLNNSGVLESCVVFGWPACLHSSPTLQMGGHCRALTMPGTRRLCVAGGDGDECPTIAPTVAQPTPIAPTARAPTIVALPAPTTIPLPVMSTVLFPVPMTILRPTPTDISLPAPMVAPLPASGAVPPPAPSRVPFPVPKIVPLQSSTAVPLHAPSAAPPVVSFLAPTSVSPAAPTGVPPPVSETVPRSAPTAVLSPIPTTAPLHVPTAVPSTAPMPQPPPLPTAVPLSAPTALPMPRSAPDRTPPPALKVGSKARRRKILDSGGDGCHPGACVLQNFSPWLAEANEGLAVASGTLANGSEGFGWLCQVGVCYGPSVGHGLADSKIRFEFIDKVRVLNYDVSFFFFFWSWRHRPGRVHTSEVWEGPSRSPMVGAAPSTNREEQSLCYQYVGGGPEA